MSSTTVLPSSTAAPERPMTREEKKVIFASSLGTVFEWYDFYLFGVMFAIIKTKFFANLDESTGVIFTLLAFAAGFAVRPFGAIIFGRLGDLVGRKYTFLITIMIMGLSTFLVGCIPTFATIGIAAPIILISLRLLQGLALGGEYGGAATYVAEHAPHGKRGNYTSWIQTTATVGLMLALLVILGTRVSLGEDTFGDWGWRIPYLLSAILLGVSLWIRLSLNESPAFKKMKDEGKLSKAPLTESFAHWGNAKIVILALVGLTAGQAVVWYTGQFYALFFLEKVLKVDGQTSNLLIAASLILGTPFFVLFGTLSDKIGRKPIIMAGCLIAAVSYFWIFGQLTHYANPALEAALQKSEIQVTADPASCAFQFNPTNTAKFTSSCDIAKAYLANNGLNYKNVDAPAGTVASVKIGDVVIASYESKLLTNADVAAAKEAAEKKLATLKETPKPEDAKAATKLADDLKAAEGAVAAFAKGGKDGMTATTKAKEASFKKAMGDAVKAAGYPAKADPAQINYVMVIVLLTLMVIYVTMVYGPIAAMLVELFPTRIRYTSMSLPYHIGNGWFGGFLPATAFAIIAARGDIYSGLWYPVIVATITLVIGTLFIKETKDVDIHA